MLGDPPGQVGGGEHQVLGPGGRAHLVPRDGGGDGRPGPAAQRVARDRGLVRVVLAPVHEHPPAAAGLRHHGGDEPRGLGGQLLGERLGVRRRALGRADRDRQVELHALAAAGARASRRVRRRRGVRPARSATRAQSTTVVPSPGSRSKTTRSGLWRPPRGPTLHCGTCSSSAARLAAHARPCALSMKGKSACSERPPGVPDPFGADPRRARAATRPSRRTTASRRRRASAPS